MTKPSKKFDKNSKISELTATHTYYPDYLSAKQRLLGPDMERKPNSTDVRTLYKNNEKHYAEDQKERNQQSGLKTTQKKRTHRNLIKSKKNYNKIMAGTKHLDRASSSQRTATATPIKKRTTTTNPRKNKASIRNLIHH